MRELISFLWVLLFCYGSGLNAQETESENSEVYPSVVTDPVAALLGKWSATDCEERWGITTLSEDKKVLLHESSTGSTARAIILDTSPGRIHIQYDPETRTTEDGTILTWWIIFETGNQYRMRQDDWAFASRTRGAWVRCPQSQ